MNALQLGLDHKIYVVQPFMGNKNPSALGVIEHPNRPGKLCEFVNRKIKLPVELGLPIFVQSYFKQDFKHHAYCYGDLSKFYVQDSALFDSAVWDFGDVSSNNKAKESR